MSKTPRRSSREVKRVNARRRIRRFQTRIENEGKIILEPWIHTWQGVNAPKGSVERRLALESARVVARATGKSVFEVLNLARQTNALNRRLVQRSLRRMGDKGHTGRGDITEV